MRVDLVLAKDGMAALVAADTGELILTGTAQDMLVRYNRVMEIHYRHHPEELKDLMCQDRKAILDGGYPF